MEGVCSQELDIPDNTLQALLKASNSTTLDNALELLIGVSNSDEGRSGLATQGILPFVLELIESLTPQSAHQPILLALRLLRNLCEGERVNQNLFIEHNGVKVILSVVNLFGIHSEEMGFTIIRAALQVLANVSLAGNDHQRAIWNQFYPDMFLKIARIRRQEICDPLSMIIYTCVDGSVELFADLCHSPGLVVVAELIWTASKAGFEEDWLKLLLSRTCLEDSYFFSLFKALSPDNASENSTSTVPNNVDDLFTPEQAFFLRVLSEILNEHPKEITIHSDFASHVLEIFQSAVYSKNFDIREFRVLDGPPTGRVLYDVLAYSLALLRDIGEGSDDMVGMLISQGLLDDIWNIYRRL